MGIGVPNHQDVATHYVYSYGSEELKKRLLPKCASGDAIGCICMTEPGAGSDAAAVRTLADQVSRATAGEDVSVGHEHRSVRAGCRGKNRTVWAIQYDLAGAKNSPQESSSLITDDWQKMVDDGFVTGPRYLRHKGFPAYLSGISSRKPSTKTT